MEADIDELSGKNKQPIPILISAGGDVGLTAAVRAQLENSFGQGLIILSAEEAVEMGLQKPASFEREPLEIKRLEPPQLFRHEPYIDKTSDQPWYTKFKKKHKKKKR